MKATITLRVSRFANPYTYEVDYDSTNPPTLWLEIRPHRPPGAGQAVDTPSRVYRLKVGEKGGLTLQ